MFALATTTLAPISRLCQAHRRRTCRYIDCPWFFEFHHSAAFGKKTKSATKIVSARVHLGLRRSDPVVPRSKSHRPRVPPVLAMFENLSFIFMTFDAVWSRRVTRPQHQVNRTIFIYILSFFFRYLLSSASVGNRDDHVGGLEGSCET